MQKTMRPQFGKVEMRLRVWISDVSSPRAAVRSYLTSHHQLEYEGFGE